MTQKHIRSVHFQRRQIQPVIFHTFKKYFYCLLGQLKKFWNFQCLSGFMFSNVYQGLTFRKNILYFVFSFLKILNRLVTWRFCIDPDF